MNGIAYAISRAALAAAAGMAASLSFAGEAQAAFTGPGVYEIRVVGTDQVLDIEWNSPDLGRRVLRWGANNGQNQKFIIFASNEGGFVIRPLHSLRCLDLPGWRTEVGIQPVQFHCTGARNQRFYFDAVRTGGHLIRSAHGGMIFNARTDGGRVELAAPTAYPATGMVFDFIPISP